MEGVVKQPGILWKRSYTLTQPWGPWNFYHWTLPVLEYIPILPKIHRLNQLPTAPCGLDDHPEVDAMHTKLHPYQGIGGSMCVGKWDVFFFSWPNFFSPGFFDFFLKEENWGLKKMDVTRFFPWEEGWKL